VYSWEFDTDEVEAQFNALEPSGRAAFLKLMDALMFDPAGYDRQPDEPAGETAIHRTVKFDRGDGLVSFYHWEPDLKVIVTRIQHS